MTLPSHCAFTEADFPNIQADGYTITSPQDRAYNCIAYAAGDYQRWWWPASFGGPYWPPGVPVATTLDAFEQAYALLGYARCADGTHEPDVQKIAIYADSSGSVRHAAIQLPDGKWSSKLGESWDLTHTTPDGVAGSIYGSVACFMSRPA